MKSNSVYFSHYHREITLIIPECVVQWRCKTFMKFISNPNLPCILGYQYSYFLNLIKIWEKRLYKRFQIINVLNFDFCRLMSTRKGTKDWVLVLIVYSLVIVEVVNYIEIYQVLA